MVLEISMYFEETPIGILVPFPYLIFFSHHTLLFIEEVLECAEFSFQNALSLRRRSLMVLEISMYFEGTPIGILVPFPYLIFFSHHTLLFFALYL